MGDEQPVPQTLESIAASLRELRTSIDTRFDKVDTRFDEMKGQLRTEIEPVRGDVRLVAEGFAAQRILLERIDNNHRRLEERVDTHDLRILALESKKPA